MNEPEDPIELSELEQRLMRCRPRSPKLDFDSIVKLTDKNAAAASIGVASNDRSRRLLTPQYVGSIAASWVCGAVVGATCFFWLSSGQQQVIQGRDSIASKEVTEPKVIGSNETAMQPAVESKVSSGESWPIDLDVETLQAGMSLPSRGLLVRTKDRSIESLASRATMKRARTNQVIEDDSDSVGESIDSGFTPAKPMTNAELLKELSGEAGFRIH